MYCPLPETHMVEVHSVWKSIDSSSSQQGRIDDPLEKTLGHPPMSGDNMHWAFPGFSVVLRHDRGRRSQHQGLDWNLSYCPEGVPRCRPWMSVFPTAVKRRTELEASATSNTVEKCVSLGETMRPNVIIKWILYTPPWQNIMRKGKGSRNGCQFSCDTGLTAGDEYSK